VIRNPLSTKKNSTAYPPTFRKGKFERLNKLNLLLINSTCVVSTKKAAINLNELNPEKLLIFFMADFKSIF
jgi:hypothetical protein